MATTTTDDHADPHKGVKVAFLWLALITAAVIVIGVIAHLGFGWQPHGFQPRPGTVDTDRRVPDSPPTTRRVPAPERVEQTMPPGMPPDASERNPYVYKGREYFWKHADCPGRIIHPYTGKPQCPTQ